MPCRMSFCYMVSDRCGYAERGLGIAWLAWAYPRDAEVLISRDLALYKAIARERGWASQFYAKPPPISAVEVAWSLLTTYLGADKSHGHGCAVA